MLVGHRVPDIRFEQRMIEWRIIRAVLPADAEADLLLHVIREEIERATDFILVAAEILEREVCADRRVAARDVETDTNDGNLVAIRCYATDRHDVTLVSVRHEGGALGAARNVAELLECAGLVL